MLFLRHGFILLVQYVMWPDDDIPENLFDGCSGTYGVALVQHGHDSSCQDLPEQSRLKDVQQIQASRFAFAAVLGDGGVVTWGSPKGGGDCSGVEETPKPPTWTAQSEQNHGPVSQKSRVE